MRGFFWAKEVSDAGPTSGAAEIRTERGKTRENAAGRDQASARARRVEGSDQAKWGWKELELVAIERRPRGLPADAGSLASVIFAAML